MSMLASLWLPTLVSAVAVFVLSSIIHMALPWWHASDYSKLPNESAVLDALRPLAIPPGEYMAPRPANNRDMSSPEFLEKMNRGPVITLNVQRNEMTSLGRSLAMWFAYILVVAFSAGAVARAALRDHNDGADIFHAVAVSAFMGFAFALWHGPIWYRRPVLTAIKATIDGALYAATTGLIFCWWWTR